MTRRIVNIVIFAIAAIACVLAIIYAAMFDSDKINQYKAVGVLHDNNPELISELSATTPETLPAYVEKCQTVAAELDGELRSEKKAKENFYDYLSTLKSLNPDNFDGFKADYPAKVKSLLDQFDTEGKYVEEFNNKVSDYKSLTNYLVDLEQEYNNVRQAYLQKEAYRNALKVVQDATTSISELNSAELKASQLADFQGFVHKSQVSSNKLLNSSFYLFYIMLFFAIAALLFFAVMRIAKNLKTSYKALVAIIALVVLFVICYLCASPILDDVFIKLQIAPETARLIEAAVYFTYVVFFAAIATIIAAPIISAIRDKKSLK